jgi:hypothetical protein
METTNTKQKIDLVDGREYLVTIGAETKLLYYRSYNAGFYDSWDEHPMHKIGEATKIEKSPNYDAKILIDGTYGDPAVLYLDGYVHTKHGDTVKIKSVDVKKGDVEGYTDSFDFSRVSSSSPNDIDATKEYIKHWLYKIHINDLRKGTVFIYNDKASDSLIECEVESIIEPNCITDYTFRILATNGLTIIYHSYLMRDIEIVSCPYTREEKVKKFIDKNCERYSSEIKDKEEFAKALIEYFDNEKE